MIAKKPVVEMKGVRDDIDEEDSEESYYRYRHFPPGWCPQSSSQFHLQEHFIEIHSFKQDAYR